MNTEEIMQLAVEMAGLPAIPQDSAIYYSGERIGRVLFGIDLGAAEVALAKDLGFDLVVSHHPAGGAAVLNFHQVLDRHVDQMIACGVPEGEAREAIATLREDKRILDSIQNYDHAPSIARLVRMPYMNIHTPLDEIGRRRMAETAASLSERARVSDLIDRLYSSFGEFRHAATRIEARVGRPVNRLGRVVVSHGAGTNGGFLVAKAYFDHGFDTVVYIHCRPEDSRRLTAEFKDTKNLVVTGHIASDSLGINPFIAALRSGGLEVTAVSGIIPPEA